MTGGTALLVGVGAGLVLLVGYAAWLLWRVRSVLTRPEPRGTTPAPSRRGRLTRGQKVLALVVFVLVATAGLLGVTEGACRLAGYGGYPPTFRRYEPIDDGHALVMTDYGGPSSYFFANRSRAGSLERTALLMPKPADTFRVMLVGGSAAKGIPYPRHLTGAAFLEAMLGDLMPDKRVEVIDLGTTAIASYPVLGMLTESLDYDPDLAVIYCGNNEYYGAYGVASLHTAGRSPASIRFTRWARSLGVTQFVESKRPGYDTNDSRTMMEAMVGEAAIAPDDPMREAAARNLETFVGDMIDRCKARGVPVIVCTPPANERGLAPIGEDDLSRCTPAVREHVDELLARAETNLEADPTAAEEAVREILMPEQIDVYPPWLPNARAEWLLGRALDAQGRSSEAVEAYAHAVDLDTMPWRCPTSSIDALRRAATEHGATLCDLLGAFRSASPGGSIGWELMGDHVHPSLAGQALSGRTIAASVSIAVPGVGFEPSAADGLPPDESYMARLGATPYDTYAAANGMRLLGRIPFFVASNPWFGPRFEAVCESIEASSPPEVVQALREWCDAPTAGGLRRPITGYVAMALFGRGRYAEAGPLFESAMRASEPYGTWELQYASFMVSCHGVSMGGMSEADRALAAEMIQRGRYLAEHGYSTSGAAERYVGELSLKLGDYAGAIEWLARARPLQSDEGRVAVDGALVQAYGRSGQRDEAEAIIQRGLEAGGPFANYYRQMQAQLQ
ncbi:MAG: tetratricopeptide repeat protein [Phycisphaeraceae bacterium]|nr:MAG: tetratricopeptide repeat protein [Phycisphaeraceae bacterium]